MFKKVLAIFISLAMMAVGLSGCNGTASSTTTSGTGTTTKQTVYLVTMDKQDQHWVSVDKGASDMASALGLTYKWDAPDVKDNAKQIEIINNAVADGANLILLAAVDPTAVSETVKSAKAKGVKFIYVDSPANEPALATLSTDNYAAGKLAAKTMVDALTTAGKTSGKIGIVGVNTATNSTLNREKGFRDYFAENGKGFTILTTEYKNGDAAASQEAAAGFITGNSDLVGIFGSNEGSTVGTGNAIKASGKTIIGVGFDKSNTIQSLLDDGSLIAAMAQNPYTMGYLGVAQAYAALNGFSTGPATIDTGVSVNIKS